MNPQTLFIPERLDLAAKHSFFASLLSGRADQSSEDIYRRHIAARMYSRGAGVAQRYVDGCLALVESFTKYGYRTTEPAVPLGRNGLPCDGAHRISLSAAMGIDIPIQMLPKDGHQWGSDWFPERDDLSRTLRSWVHLNREAAVFVFFSPAEGQWETMQQRLRVAGTIELSFSPGSFEAIVHDLYASHSKRSRIDEKVRHLTGHAPKLLAVAALDSDANTKKEALRAMCPVKRDLFITCHASADHTEACHLADTLFSPVNIAHARLRGYRPQLASRLRVARTLLADQGIPENDCCVTGGAVLDALGLKECDDIDITVTPELRKRYGRGPVQLAPGLDLVSQHYSRAAITDADLIDSSENHFLFHGMKFAALPIVRARKAMSDHEKDRKDIERIAQRGLSHWTPQC